MPYKDPEKRREMARIYTKRWRERNPERVKETWRKWREENLEYDRTRCLEYRHDNIDYMREYQAQAAREWRKNHPGYAKAEYAANPDRFKAKNAKRSALKRGATHSEVIDPLVVLERDDGICGICGEDVDPLNFHVDHVIPLSRGGSHTYGNVQTAHPACNCSKRADLPEAA